jgi:hypothetical protein
MVRHIIDNVAVPGTIYTGDIKDNVGIPSNPLDKDETSTLIANTAVTNKTSINGRNMAKNKFNVFFQKNL